MNVNICRNCFKPVELSTTKCPCCGFEEGIKRLSNILPLGYMLEGHLRVGRQIGNEGGFGIAYLCFNTRLENLVVVKELFPQDVAVRSTNGVDIIPFEAKRRQFEIQKDAFLSEARTLAKINHPSIVNVRHFFEAHGTAYFVMDFYEGQPLNYMVSSQGALPYKKVLDILMPVVRGVKEVHQQGILHRDIKPENIQICDNGLSVLLDFGNAKGLGNTKKDAVLGVSRHFAPLEQINGEFESMGVQTDIYSLCALFYYCLTGQRPIDASDRQVKNLALNTFSELNIKLPKVLAEAIFKGMSLLIEDRFQSIQAFEDSISSLNIQNKHIWTDLIPETLQGSRVKFISKKIKEGKNLPFTFNPFAFLLQWCWLFGYRIYKWGIISAIWGLSAILLTIFNANLWPLTILLLIINAFVCGFLGNTFLYYSLESLSKVLKFNSESDLKEAKNQISDQLKLKPKFMFVGYLVFVISILAYILKIDFNANVKDQVHMAISGGSVMEIQSAVMNKTSNGLLDMTKDDVKSIESTFNADDEVQDVELIGLGTTMIVTLGKSISSVSSRQLLLKMQKNKEGNIIWKCEPYGDFPIALLPIECQ